MNYYVERTITKNGQITVGYSGPYTEAEAFIKAQEDTYSYPDENYSQVCKVITK